VPTFPRTQENRREERVNPPLQTPASEHRGDVGSGSALAELPPEAANDAVLQRLLQGDITGYQSQSSADFVLIMKLLHWTGDDKALTRQLFLSSPLGKREKAERKTGETTYVDLTIENVIKKRRNPPMRR
jgi:primase-polymerase (primpol)-like protein